MDEIAARRADKAGDNRLWSAEDALENAMKAVKGKDVHLAVHWFEMTKDGARVHHFSAANATYPEHIALLEIAMYELIRNWTE